MSLSSSLVLKNHEIEESKAVKLANIGLYWSANRIIPEISGARSVMTEEQIDALHRVELSISYSGMKKDMRENMQKRNLCRLIDIGDEWESMGITSDLVNKVCSIILNLYYQPLLFPTGRNSIQLQYELFDRSYLEFEIFENMTTCMVVPARQYEKAVFPTVNDGDYSEMNRIIKEFYNATNNSVET